MTALQLGTDRAITLRQATSADAAQLAHLRYEFRATIGSVNEAEDTFVARTTPWLEQRLASTHWRVWVATAHDKGDIVGHAYLQLIEKIPNPIEEAEWIGYVTNVYVRPAYRGSGIGRELVAHIVAHCRRKGDVANLVLWPTARSRGLYESFGFATPTALLELTMVG